MATNTESATSKEQFTFFWRKESPFSQFHDSEFKVNGVRYKWAEQYMMHQKAVLFDDDDTAILILQASSPPKCRSLGRKVKGFDDDIWKENRMRIVEEGNYHKFTQNEKLLEKLLGTQGTTLVEASPTDTIWGIGLGEHDERARNRETWRGLNLLGTALNNVQERILNERKEES